MAKPFSPHPPSPKQRAFLELDAQEAFYGGAAGGGKSDAAILAALQYVDVPTYSAGIFRRTEVDLNKPGAVLDRARMWFAGTAARWDQKAHGFRFPSYDSNPGALIHFGYGTSRQELDDRYQGTEFQYIGIDELGQWLLVCYQYLFTRIRRLTNVAIPTRMRGFGNPGGRGAEWVRDRFIQHARHVVTRESVREYVTRRKRGNWELADPPYFESPPSPEAIELAKELGQRPQGAFFVPAYAQDNPGLDLAEYRMQLVRADAQTRAQMEHGDWWAIGGGKFFKEEWFQFCDGPPPGMRFIRYWDLAATKAEKGKDPDWSAGAKLGLFRFADGSRRVYIADVKRFREAPGGTENKVKATAELDTRRVPVWMEEEAGSAGKNNTHNYATKVLFGWVVKGHRKTGPKPEYWKPLSSVAENGGLYLVRGEWNAAFVSELCALTDDDSHAHDDQADAAAGGLAVLLDDSGAGRLHALANAIG